MKVSDRPYAGNWSEDFVNKYRKTRSWTPDAIVTFNGETTLPGCPTCRNKIDFSRFISSVNASGGIDGSNGCDIGLKIPWAYGDSVYKDGKFILVSGIEVFVYYRGFFQVKDLALKADNIDLDNGEILSAPDAEVRPYYPVFHGVISGVSVSLTDGAYEVSISTRNMLSFWDNQQINTQQGYFAADPTMSRGSVNLRGHVYTGMTPHQVIYDLFLDAGGSAEGTGFALSKQSNIKARSGTGPQLYSLMIRYLEQRFKNGMYGLRMYGASGRMYSAIETQILANKAVTKSEKSAEFRSVVKRQNKPYSVPKDNEISFSRLVKAGLIAFEHNNATDGRVQRTMDARYLAKVGEKDKTGLSVFSLKPFVPDLGSFGQIQFFESNMESKKSIADRVCEATGYEFYQDMDGDLVFKPPMYNMDTSSDRVYNIYREDIISISFSHAEPEATYVTMKGSHFRNFNGAAPTGEWGVKGVYVDYALVAKYGWKGQDFDSSFYNTARQAYYAAAVELDKQNKTTEGCDITIPLRPEIKAGYPIYIEENDCFYYVESVNHSFSYGGSCTTSLTLTCQRKKFIPPGDASVKYRDDPSRAVDLGRTELPERYLYKRYDRTDEGSRQINAQAQESDVAYKKITGFPNVVMAFDHLNISPSMLFYTPDFQNIGGKNPKERELYRNMIINEGLRLGILNAEPGVDLRKGPWFLMVPSKDGGSPRKVKLPLEGTEIAGTQKLREISDTSRIDAKKAAKAIGKGGHSSKVDKARKKEADRLEGLQGNIQKAVGTAGVYSDSATGVGGGNNATGGAKDQATILDLIYLIQSPQGRNPGTSPLQNLVSALSDKKSSFVPKAQGYFRYYSSSHPSPEHQGPDLIEYAEQQDLVFNDNVPDTVRDNIVIAKPDGDGDTVMFGNDASTRQEVVRGLMTRTMYSNGLEYVPTKDITSLAFQVSGTMTKQSVDGPIVTTTQVWYQRNYIPGLEYWDDAYKSVKKHLSGKETGISLQTKASEIFNYFNKEAKNPLDELTIPLVKKDMPLALWDSDEAKEYFNNSETKITRTTPDTLESLNLSHSKISLSSDGTEILSEPTSLTNRKILAGHFASIILFALREKSKELFPDAYKESLWEALIADPSEESLKTQEGIVEKVTGYVENTVSSLSLPGIVFISKSRTNFEVTKKGSIVTPIFPISDAKGYEVFGAYQYGRGLSPSRGTLFDALLRQDPSQVLTPKGLDDAMGNLDEASTKADFRKKLKQQYIRRVMELSAEDRDRLRVGLGLDAEKRDTDENAITEEASVLANRLMTRSDEQIITNIPSALSEIYPSEDGNEVCECRIHSTDAILLEGSLDLDNFLEIENPALRGIRNMTEKKSVEWREHQTALRGENLQRIQPGQGGFATSSGFGDGFDFNNRGNNRLLTSFTEINEDADTLQASFRNPFAGSVSSASAGADQLSDQAKAVKAASERVGGDDND